MINHNLQFIFIHVPRTGGTSIEWQFGYRRDMPDKHWRLDDYEKTINCRPYFKFAFVRNPWDVVISKYVSSWYNQADLGGNIGKHSGKSLKYFLLHYQPAEHEFGDSYFDYFLPEDMNFIGRYENRDCDLEYISKNIGFDLSASVLKRRNPRQKNYRKYYNDETREMVAKKYSREIQYYEYKF